MYGLAAVAEVSRSKELVSRIVFARTVNFGKNTGLSPNISVPHTVPISF
jgi:hypothetical protein